MSEISVKAYALSKEYKYSSVTSRLNKDINAPKPVRIEKVDGLCSRRYYNHADLENYFRDRPIREWGQ